MRDLNDLFFFVQVVEEGGFAAAARKLGMPRSRLSRRIGLLEERLGLRLIQRSTRRFAVTEIGREYHAHCVAMLVEAEAAQEVIDRVRGRPQGIVRISCPTALAYFQIGDMVARFMTECPDVEVHLESTNRRVDVIREGLDMAVRVRFPPFEASDLVMRVLAESTQCLVASPDFARSLPSQLAPADLEGVQSLSWTSPQRPQTWTLIGPDAATAVIRHKPKLVTEDMVALRFATLRGLGVAQFPTMLVAGDLAAGTLINLLPDWAPQSGQVQAIFPSRRGLLPSVRALLDFLARDYAALARAEQRLRDAA